MMRWIVCAAPSAIWSIALPCSAFEAACVSARLCVRSLLAIDRPAASSAARLIRSPELNFRMLLSTAMLLMKMLRDAVSAPTFVLIRMDFYPP